MTTDAIEARLRAQVIETPSWGYGPAGTRFGSFPPPWAPRDIHEKIDDAAEVHRHTGVAGAVALHIPWDAVEDYGALREHAAARNLRIGAVNPNLFQDQAYKLGSVCNPDPAVRRQATDHLLECADIARALQSDALSLWFADGTSYAGQDSFVERRERMLECLSELAEQAPDLELLIEYKLYEPAFYATDLADWGSALLTCQKLGPHARVLVDLGHHAHGVNIEQIVATLATEDRLGGFHFNNRRYGDDDLIVGSVNPFELFLIYVELVEAEEGGVRIDYMIDQAHNIEAKMEAMILSVANLQEAYAKALLVDRAALDEARRAGDVVGTQRAMLDAYNTDVRPLCAKAREDLGAARDPISAFRQSGYLERVTEERKEGTQAGWG
jgi:L-rhamnose isomerase/sugar isomerase